MKPRTTNEPECDVAPWTGASSGRRSWAMPNVRSTPPARCPNSALNATTDSTATSSPPPLSGRLGRAFDELRSLLGPSRLPITNTGVARRWGRAVRGERSFQASGSRAGTSAVPPREHRTAFDQFGWCRRVDRRCGSRLGWRAGWRSRARDRNKRSAMFSLTSAPCRG